MKIFVACHCVQYQGITHILGSHQTREEAEKQIESDKIDPKEKHNELCYWQIDVLEMKVN